MSLEVFIALLGFSFVASATPGPNTLMLFASGINFGFKRTVPHMVGVIIGFAALLLAVGFGLGALFERIPHLFTAIKVLGGIYMLYLAWRIANAGAIESKGSGAAPMRMHEAALFQWVNPKAWIMGGIAVALYTSPENYTWTVVLVVLAFVLVSLPSVILWAGFGTALRRLLSDPVWLRRINIAMALALVASLWPMLR
ncbi:MAG: LysE family translocator [Pseudomonadota bacterium]